jgi:hypothetical protein
MRFWTNFCANNNANRKTKTLCQKDLTQTNESKIAFTTYSLGCFKHNKIQSDEKNSAYNRN